MTSASAERGRLLFIVNVGWFFVSHRLPLAIAAKAEGYDVHVATALEPGVDDDTPRLLAEHGIELHQLRLSRNGAHPIELLRDFYDLLRLYQQLAPDFVHLVALKPLLLGGLAAKFAGLRAVVMAVPGRGSVFSAKGAKATLRRWIAVLMYRMAYLKGRSRVIIQNVEDQQYFLERGVFAPDHVRLIRGSGVDIRAFLPQPEPVGLVTVVFASRMLREKGVAEFVAAASRMRREGNPVRFILVGDPDHGNPHSHTRAELEAWVASGAVEWSGFQKDMNAVFGGAHVVCLPTYYGEGVPKVLIEAAACGRPIITTDMPGCRDIVRHRENGLLVKARDVCALVEALTTLVSDAALRAAMGRRGREIVESEFSLDIVVKQTLDIYKEFVS
jgi:glycosyltransferase involved in cell wall biosynthesis